MNFSEFTIINIISILLLLLSISAFLFSKFALNYSSNDASTKTECDRLIQTRKRQLNIFAGICLGIGILTLVVANVIYFRKQHPNTTKKSTFDPSIFEYKLDPKVYTLKSYEDNFADKFDGNEDNSETYDPLEESLKSRKAQFENNNSNIYKYNYDKPLLPPRKNLDALKSLKAKYDAKQYSTPPPLLSQMNKKK